MKNKIKAIMVVFLILATTMIGSAGTLRMTEKNPNTWVEITGGATATMTYNSIGATFDYTITGTVPDKTITQYSAIYYKDQTNPFVNWGLVGVVIANGTIVPNSDTGAFTVSGSSDIGTIPQAGDINTGAKIWIVPTSNIHTASDGKTLVPDWNPTKYLFEENLRDENGIELPATSDLITYTKGTGGSVEVLGCPPSQGTIGVTTTESTLNYGALIPGATSAAQTLNVVVTASGYSENACGNGAPTSLQKVTITLGDWIGENSSNTMPSTSTSLTTPEGNMYPFGTTPVPFTLTVPVGTVPDMYHQVVTVTLVS